MSNNHDFLSLADVARQLEVSPGYLAQGFYMGWLSDDFRCNVGGRKMILSRCVPAIRRVIEQRAARRRQR